MRYHQPFDQPNNPNASYQNANPATGLRGSILDIIAVEQTQREILEVITQAGLVPTDADLTQLWQAIQASATSIANTVIGNILVNNNIDVSIPFCAVGGTANALTGTFAPAPPSIFPGLLLEVQLGNAPNSGGATINPNGLGVTGIVHPDGSALNPGDLPANGMALLSYSGVQGKFILVANGLFSTGAGSSTKPGVTGQLVLTLGNAALTGTLKANGAAVSRSTYSALWTFAQASGRIVSDTDWLNGANQEWPCFSSGDGSTTFRLPDFRGEFMRFVDDGRGIDISRVLGKWQADAVGSFSMTGGSVTITDLQAHADSPQTGDGWFFSPQVGPVESNGGQHGSDSGSPVISGIDAIRGLMSLSGNGGASETRPRNVAIMPCIVY